MAISYIQAIRKAIIEKMKEDKNIIALGQDLKLMGGSGKLFQSLHKNFDNRIIDTPISEAGTAGIATGASMIGLKPIVEFSFIDFALSAMDPIINQAGKINFLSANQFKSPVVFRGVVNSKRAYGATHSQNLESLFTQIPGLNVVYPSTPNDAYNLMKSSFESDKPTIFIEHKLLHNSQGKISKEKVKIGKAEIKKTGNKVTIITYGRLVPIILDIAKKNSDIEVLDLRSLKPLDMNLIKKSVKKPKKAIIIEDGYGFISAEIISQIKEELNNSEVHLKRIFTKRILPSVNKDLEKETNLSKEFLKEKIEELI